MKIGDLDTRVQLWAPSSTVDAFGQPIVSFTKTAEVWAHRRDKAGAEVVVGDRLVMNLRTEFTIRFRSDLDEKSIVKFGGKDYRIDGVLTIGRNRFLKLICSRRDD